MAAMLATGAASCAGPLTRDVWHPIPEQPPAHVPPELRGDEPAAVAIPWAQQLEIIREVVRGFFRPRSGQARWIDPRPLAYHRTVHADSMVLPEPEWASAIADAVGLVRVCPLGGSDAECRGRRGGVLRFSTAFAAGPDSALVFARYTPVRQGATPASGPGFEIEFRLARRDGRWRIVNRRTIAGPEEGD